MKRSFSARIVAGALATTSMGAQSLPNLFPLPNRSGLLETYNINNRPIDLTGPFFQSLGMQFGRDQNAFTSYDQTTYQLSLPDTKPETLCKGMMFFADVVGRLSLLPSEIDNERQIILEVLESNGWNRNATADTLGINRTTLYKKMKRLGLEDRIEARTP